MRPSTGESDAEVLEFGVRNAVDLLVDQDAGRYLGAKLRGERYDTVVLDPPFFSSTDHGALDLDRDTARLINKVRPLVATSGGLREGRTGTYRATRTPS